MRMARFNVIGVDARDTQTLASGEWSSLAQRPGLGAVYASLTNGAVSVLRLLMGTDKVIMKAKAEDIHDAPKRFLKKLGYK